MQSQLRKGDNFHSIVQQQSNSSIINREHNNNTPITDCRAKQDDNQISLGDELRLKDNRGRHLLRPDWH